MQERRQQLAMLQQAGVRQQPVPVVGVALAALWMVLLLCVWPASSGALLGFGVTIVDEGTRNDGRYLDELQSAAAALSAPAAPAPGSTTASTQIAPQPLLPGAVRIQGTTIIVQGGPSNPQFGVWWAKQDQAAVLASAGGWPGVFDHAELLLLIPAAAVAFLIGCFWSVFLIQVPRRWLIFCAIAIVGLACLLALIPVLEWGVRSATSARRAAAYQLAGPTLLLYFSVVTVPLLAGLRVGRSLARALLPPRLRGPFALLWTADGKEPDR